MATKKVYDTERNSSVETNICVIDVTTDNNYIIKKIDVWLTNK